MGQTQTIPQNKIEIGTALWNTNNKQSPQELTRKREILQTNKNKRIKIQTRKEKDKIQEIWGRKKEEVYKEEDDDEWLWKLLL